MKSAHDIAPLAGRSSSRRHLLRVFGGSVALAGLALAGCADMKADPQPKRPKTHITGRGGGPGPMK